jgi:transcriptional regulator with XRE-family HTH domain
VGAEPVKIIGQRVARRVRELRRERSLTLAQLAARLAELDRSYNLSTLSRIEQGQRRVDTDDLVALALALDVPPNAILFPPDEHYEARTKLTANIEADTAAVLRWAVSGDAQGIRGQAQPAAGPMPTRTGPVHRSIVAVDLERRSNAVRGEVRRALYDLLGRALQATGIGPKHLGPMADRGDGVLILIRPHDDVPKMLLLNQLMPTLNSLLSKHNTTASKPELQLRLRAVVHAGEVHYDDKGMYGEDIDVAFRLLDSATVKKALREERETSLIVVVSDEIYSSVIRHGYAGQTYKPVVRVRVGSERRNGWINIPSPSSLPPASADS